MRQVNHEFVGILLGIILLFFIHVIATIAIFLIGLILLYIPNQSYAGAIVWLYGASSFLFWQLLYVIPVVLLLKKQRRIGMMKGVIIGAVITALLNGGCFLLLHV